MAEQAEPMDIDENAANEYTDRMSRTAGALGMKMLANLRSLNVLIVGMRGVGVETAKNLILTGPKSVTIYDREPTRIVDLGANFYLNMAHVKAKVPRADAVHSELQGLNPYCSVKSFDGTIEQVCDDLLARSDDSAFGCVIVTEILPKAVLYRMNGLCRQQNIVFLMALTTGVTASLFSDFGPKHVCTDIDGEPTETFAVSLLEVVEKTQYINSSGMNVGDKMAVVTIASKRHGLDDGDLVEFDDLSGPLEPLNGVPVPMKRIYFKTPRDNDLQKELEDNQIQDLINKNSMSKVASFLDAKAAAYPAITSFREKQMLNRFVIDMDGLKAAGVNIEIDAFSQWSQGGLVNQKKKPVEFNHLGLEETLATPAKRYPGSEMVAPQHMNQELWEKGAGTDIHIFWAAVLEFFEQNKSWPKLHNNDDAKKFYDICQSINKERSGIEGGCTATSLNWNAWPPAAEPRDVDEVRAKRFSRYFPTELTGLCAFLGGAVAQEVVKRFGKYKPIDQWLHYDDQDLITDEAPTNLGPLMGSRYDWQIAVLGKTFQARLADQKIFLVGCGALGCEYLKGISLMGVATGSKGQVWVTDMDRIEVSNLSRQFLFRQEHVSQPKSVCGAKVVKQWNSALNIQSLEMFVGPKTENFFDDKFWENLDLCWNALDNVKARQYTDSRCLFFSKPLLESGTLGTKCNGEIILPFRTKSYNDGVESDDNENQIAMCTLKNFPYLPLHCIEYARQSYFTNYFEDEPQKYEQFREDLDGFLETISSEGAKTRMNILKRMQRLVDAQKGGVSFADCILLAFDQMMTDYRNIILDLIFSNPEDKKKEDGSPFWSGTKRFPRVLDFAYDNALAMEYLYCAANMYAFVFGVEHIRDKAQFMEAAQALNLANTSYKPKFIDTKKEEEAENAGEEEETADDAMEEDDIAVLEAMEKWARGVDRTSLKTLMAHDFEKDDDSNFHIDFMTISTNLRAFNYQIKLSTRLKVKLTAGRIIPALATTTAMVCGLTELEFCKLVLGLESQGTTKFKNSNINLGTATFNVFEPTEAITKSNGVPKNFTSWDKLTVDAGNMTCGEFVQFMDMNFPGLEFAFLTNPLVNPEEMNPILFAPAQAKAGQIAIETQNDMHNGVFKQFPQARFASQMISRFEEGSNNYNKFAKMLEGAKAWVEEGKAIASQSIYDIYVKQYGTPLAGRDGIPRKYLILAVEDAKMMNEEGEIVDVEVPRIKFVYTH